MVTGFATSPDFVGPIVGVVDGSDAAPGEVGEFLTAIGTFNYAASPATSTGQLAMINMPPGDWDIWASASFTTLIESTLFHLNPVPTGMSNSMFGLMGLFSVSNLVSMDVETLVLVGQTARGSFAVPTLLSFEVQVFQGSASLPAGTMILRVEARRRR
jgi:hypothetical protein